MSTQLTKSNVALLKERNLSLQWYVADLENLVRGLYRELNAERNRKQTTARELRSAYRVDGFVSALTLLGFTRSQAAELVKEHRREFALEDDHELALAIRRLDQVRRWHGESYERSERQRDYEARAFTRQDDIEIAEAGAP